MWQRLPCRYIDEYTKKKTTCCGAKNADWFWLAYRCFTITWKITMFHRQRKCFWRRWKWWLRKRISGFGMRTERLNDWIIAGCAKLLHEKGKLRAKSRWYSIEGESFELNLNLSWRCATRTHLSSQLNVEKLKIVFFTCEKLKIFDGATCAIATLVNPLSTQNGESKMFFR